MWFENTKINCFGCPSSYLPWTFGPKKIYMHRSWFHNKNDTTPAICDECGKTCGNQRKLDAHKKSHIVLPCQFCGKFISSLNMKNHLDRLAQLYASQSQENGGLGYFCARAKGIFWFLKEVLDIRG